MHSDRFYRFQLARFYPFRLDSIRFGSILSVSARFYAFGLILSAFGLRPILSGFGSILCIRTDSIEDWFYFTYCNGTNNFSNGRIRSNFLWAVSGQWQQATGDVQKN